MASGTVDSIERTVHKTNEWVADLARELGTEDQAEAWRVLRAYLQLLRGRKAAERFNWQYSDEELKEIGARADRFAKAAAHVRLMFANGSYAMAAAQRMRALFGQTTLTAAGSDPAGASRRG